MTLPVRRSLFFSALLFISVSAHAQIRKAFAIPPKDTSSFLIFHDVTGGPYLTMGAARQNEDLPATWTSSPKFSWIFGGTLDLAINKWYGFVFSMLYDSRDLYVADTTKDYLDLSLGYLSFQPSIRIFWLLIGLSFDIPLSGSATEYIDNYTRADQNNGQPQHYNENINVQTSDLQSFTELRAVLSIPILQNDNAELHFVVSGSYPLSKALTGTSSFDTTGVTATNLNGGQAKFSGPNMAGKGPLPTFEAGITYQFDLIH